MTSRKRGALVSVRLLVRLLEECPWDLPEDATVRRLYPGRHQRAAGAWSWTVEGTFVRSPLSIGSQYSMAECLAASRLDFTVDAAGSGQIDPSHPL
jgi:hypothetical protein